jgi:hypothetical protein
MSETPLESSAEDVAEQRTEVLPDEAASGITDRVSLEVDPADAQEQDVEVPLDEDEWR